MGWLSVNYASRQEPEDNVRIGFMQTETPDKRWNCALVQQPNQPLVYCPFLHNWQQLNPTTGIGFATDFVANDDHLYDMCIEPLSDQTLSWQTRFAQRGNPFTKRTITTAAWLSVIADLQLINEAGIESDWRHLLRVLTEQQVSPKLLNVCSQNVSTLQQHLWHPRQEQQP